MSQAKHDSIPISRRAAITGAAAAAAVPVAALGPAAAAETGCIDWPAALLRAEQMVDVLRTGYIRQGWHEAFDEAGAARLLNYFRNPDPPDVPGDRFVEEVARWVGDHNQSLDWLLLGDPAGLICEAANRSVIN